MRTSLRTLPPPDTLSCGSAPVSLGSFPVSLGSAPVRLGSTPISLGTQRSRSRPRATNEYVESPRPPQAPPLKSHVTQIIVGSAAGSPGFAHRVGPRNSGGGSGGGVSSTVHGSPRPSTCLHSSSPVISLQPLSKSPLKKESAGLLETSAGDAVGSREGSHAAGDAECGDGIMCEACGKCRCGACTDPRPLPSHWCCKDKCEASPAKALEFCSCFCCVKGCFYHCGGAGDDAGCYERPCGCMETPRCGSRWAVISLMSICLPCLWFYWPGRACLSACSACYNCRRPKGCQCRQRNSKTVTAGDRGVSGVNPAPGGGGVIAVGGRANPKHSQTRRLLIESDSSSA